MLKLTWKRDFQEVVGQLPPTLLINTFIWTNEIPERKANINDSDKMSIPENVQQILNQ